MVDNRRGYAGMVLLSLLLLFWTENGFFLAVFVLELLFPAVLSVLLRSELRKLSFRWSCLASCTAGQELNLEISAERRRRGWAAGVARMQVSCCQVMFGQTVSKTYEMKLTNRIDCIAGSIPTDLCGKLRIRCEKLELCDLFGLCCVQFPPLPEQTVMVYPAAFTMLLSLRDTREGGRERSQDTVGEKGNDISEVFDLRSYQDGDDVRSIHWKLSAKTASLLVREFCETARYDTLVLVDVSLKSRGGEPEPELAAAGIAFGSSVSRELIRRGFPHGVAFVSENRLFDFSVTDQKQFEDVLEQWLCVRLPEQNGMGIRYLKLHEQGLDCRKLLYVTSETCPDTVAELSQELDVTVVCLTGQGVKADVVKQEHGWLFHLPVSWLQDHTCRIFF